MIGARDSARQEIFTTEGWNTEKQQNQKSKPEDTEVTEDTKGLSSPA